MADAGFGVPPLVSSQRGTNFGTYSAQTRCDSGCEPVPVGHGTAGGGIWMTLEML